MPKRRGHHEGSVFKRKSGERRGEIVVQITLDSGRSRQFTTDASGRRFRSEADARAFLLDLRAARAEGEREPSRQTVGEFLEEWLRISVEPLRRPNTLASRTGDIRRHIAPALGAVRMSKLSPRRVQEFVNDLRARTNPRTGKPYHPQTVRSVAGTLHAALAQAVAWGELRRNPAENVELPPLPERRIRYLEPSEIDQFLDANREHPFYPLCACAFYLGLRRGEILGMRIQDLDLDGRAYTVRGNLQPVAGVLTVCEPKTHGSVRTLVLPLALVAVLRAHLARRELARRIAGEEWEETGLVFTLPDGRPINPRRFNEAFRDMLNAAGVDVGPGIGLHLLRHTHASLLSAGGNAMPAIAAALGHDKISTTSRYVHVLEAGRQAVADTMDRYASRDNP